MENKITYIEDEVFRKLTKKQKLELPEHSNYTEVEISKLVLIPTNRKNDGWSLGSFFAYSPDKGWWRPMTYDCWRINTEIGNPATIKYMILKGDFEYGGVNIFSFVDEYHTAFMSYGGEIIIKKKCVPYFNRYKSSKNETI